MSNKQTTLHETEAKIYNKIKTRITILEMIINLLVLYVFSFTSLSLNLHAYLEFRFSNPYLQFILFMSILTMTFSITGLPLSYYSSFIIEHQFKLSNQTKSEWVLHTLKSSLVSIVIALPLLLAFYALLRSTGTYWWFYFSIVLFLFSILLTRLAPIVLFPLFHKFSPLEDEKIKTKIDELLQKENKIFQGIYTFDMSKNTKKANAGFTGLGKSKRIILSDTLVAHFTPDEIETIFAHELGHYTHKHILKNICISGCTLFLSFYLCNLAYVWTITRMQLLPVYSISALPVLFLYMSIFGFLIMPITNAISREFEREADTYALLHTKNKNSFISSMEKLAEINLADKEPHPLIEFLFHSHPALQKRINFAKEFEPEKKI